MNAPENVSPWESEGLPFYRCCACSTVISVWDIDRHNGCAKCGCRKIRTTNLSIWEVLKQITLHPLVWLWKKRPEYYVPPHR